jgi:dephospho-CoA kinase
MNLQSDLVQSPEFRQSFMNVRIFGIAGSNGSGKDTLLTMFASSGYFVFNTGDNLRQISTAVMGTTQRGGNDSPTGRIANAQRATYPGGMVSLALIDYWSRILHLPAELQPKGLAIGSIRAVGEAKVLKEFGGLLVSVDADPQARYNRIVSRGRTYESLITFEQFLKEDEAEMGYNETDPTKFSIAQVMAMADTKLTNNYSDPEQFMEYAKHELAI